MGDPFFITGPALISFSGGRTSAYMLWRILEARRRRMVQVAFANTGKEREWTTRFDRMSANAPGAARWILATASAKSPGGFDSASQW
ncbi:MAG: hypothetical protein IPG83_02190 [Novosphingobium sp.]|nr:hypothetical protein [Novosphingobium sp.]